jgi:peptidoglycan/xylan/chitin deacetylase (PgdA/CDA1 family)
MNLMPVPVTRRTIVNLSLATAAAAIINTGVLPDEDGAFATAAVSPTPFRKSGLSVDWSRQWHDTVATSTGNRSVAFTFDDGPHVGASDLTLDFLAERHLKATFCLIGEVVAEYWGEARKLVDAGMEIANHTWDHDETLGNKRIPYIISNIRRAQDVIYSTTGVIPRLFRAPGGNWTENLIDVLEGEFHRMIPLGWSADSKDWARPGVAAVVGNIESHIRRGGIMVFHDLNGCSEETHAALPIVYNYLVAHGYVFSQVSAESD